MRVPFPAASTIAASPPRDRAAPLGISFSRAPAWVWARRLDVLNNDAEPLSIGAGGIDCPARDGRVRPHRRKRRRVAAAHRRGAARRGLRAGGRDGGVVGPAEHRRAEAGRGRPRNAALRRRRVRAGRGAAPRSRDPRHANRLHRQHATGGPATGPRRGGGSRPPTTCRRRSTPLAIPTAPGRAGLRAGPAVRGTLG